MRRVLFLLSVCMLLWIGRAGAQEAKNVQLVGRWPYGPAKAVAADESRKLAFLGSGGGIYILDVSDPSAPRKLFGIVTPGMVNDLFYNDGTLFVADGESGLRIIDVSTPSSPTEIGYFYTPGYAGGVTVSGSLAYVADRFGGMSVLQFAMTSSVELSPGWNLISLPLSPIDPSLEKGIKLS